MAFYPLPEYTPTDNEIVNVAELMVGTQYIKVSCFPKTGTLFMNGLFAPKHLTVEKSLEWYLKESMRNYEIRMLCFQLGVNDPRSAHSWEQFTFMNGHWRTYAKNNIRISATLASIQNEDEDEDGDENIYFVNVR